MRKRALCLAFGLALASTGYAFAFGEAVAKKVVTNAVDLYIRPAYQHFHQQTQVLAEETEKFCAKPTSEQLDKVKARFGDAAESWAKVEIIREGPVLQKSRFERILFYPDRKSLGQKQIQAILANPDDTATDAAKLSSKSVAVQGLGAFEYALFGSDSAMTVQNASKDAPAQCAYALAIARNVDVIAGELQAEWDAPEGIAKSWKEPGPGNPVFRTGAEAIQVLVGIHVHAVEMIVDQRIKPFYAGKNGKKTPKAALFWRTGNTARMIHGNVEALDQLWKVSEMSLLLDADSGSLSDAVLFDYKAARNVAGKLDSPTADALKETKYLAKLDFIDFNLRDAIKRIDTDVAGAIGLGAGFSFADGD